MARKSRSDPNLPSVDSADAPREPYLREPHLAVDRDASNAAPQESDAHDRVRDWELPVREPRRRDWGWLTALGFVVILGLLGYLAIGLRNVKPVFPHEAQTNVTSSVVAVTSKEVSQLPTTGPTPKKDEQIFSPRQVAGQTVAGTLVPPSEPDKWALAEMPATGERIEIDRAGIYARAKNFTEACVGAPDKGNLRAGARARDTVGAVRSYITNNEICASVFDEPYMELDIDGALLAAQFGLQQGVPYVAVKRLAKSGVPLAEVARRLP